LIANGVRPGLEPTTVIGRPIYDFIQPQYHAAARKCLEHVFQTGEGASYESVGAASDGSMSDYVTDVGPVIVDGEIIAATLISRDTTDHKRAEKALRESEERYRLLAECIPHPVWRSDAQGMQIDCNRRWQEYTGQTPEEAQGTGWMKALHPDDVPRAVERVREDVPGGTIYQAEYRLHRASDDSYHWYLARAIPWRDANGTILGWFGSATDIDAQKQAQEALIERESQLLEAQAVASLGFYVFDIPQNNWTSSTVLDRLFGISADYTKTVDGWSDLLHPDERQVTLDYLLKEVIGKKKPFDREYRIVRHGDKQVRWVHGLGRLQLDEDGQPVFLLGTIQDITDRKQAEETLRVSESRFRSLFQDSVIGMAVVSPNGELAQVNSAFCEFLGYSEHELTGKTVNSITHPEDRDGTTKVMRRTLNSGPPVLRVEKRYLHKSGQVLWGEVSSTLVHDVDGNPRYFIAQVLDISERKRAEEALKRAHDELERRVEERTKELITANKQLKWEVAQRQRTEEALQQSERQFRNYFEQGLIGMAVTSLDKRWLLVNDRLCEILGYSREEITQTNWAALTHPDDIEPNLRLFNSLLAGEIDYFTLNKRYLKKDGGSVHTTIHTRAFRRNDGTVDHIVTLIEDITARQQAEDALRNREYLLRNVLDTNPSIIFVKDRDSKILLGNEALARFYGITLQQIVGTLHTDLHAGLRMSPQEIAQWLADDRAAIDTGITQVLEERTTWKDGSVHWYHTTKLRIALPGGQPGVLVVSEDITERKQAEEALHRERRTLEHMLKASDHERQLIAYDIHDGLAQYLTGAIMHLQMSEHLREQSIDESAKSFEGGMALLRQGHSEARRLISGVRLPILDESGVMAAISHLIHDPAFNQGPKIDFRSRVTFSRLNPVVENVIYRIVQEGLSNARNHSKSRNIVVSLVQRGERLRIEIRDWGVGFDPKTVPENHFGVDGIHERARLLGGKCNIKSKPGEGTVVVVELPVVEQRQEE
jgi:PAS domain S-box-containing protein